MRYILQEKYTDKEWKRTLHHPPNQENIWKNRGSDYPAGNLKIFNTKEEGELWLDGWNKLKHKPRGILLRIVEEK